MTREVIVGAVAEQAVMMNLPRRRVNFPLVGFKPNPIIVRSDSQSGDAIQELVQRGELHWIHLFGEFRINGRLFLMTWEVIIGAKADRAVITKSPSRRVCPKARAPLEVILSLITRRSINPVFDVTGELSMKAPMSVSKPADLG